MTESTPMERRRTGGENQLRQQGGDGYWKNTPAVSITLLCLVCALAALLTGPSFRFSPNVYSAGEIADKAVRAHAEFLINDEVATEAKRVEASQAVPSIYDLNKEALSEVLSAIDASFDVGETEPVAQPETEEALDNAWLAMQELVSERWSVEITDALAQLLIDTEERTRLKGLVARALAPAFVRGVVANRDLLIIEFERGVLIADSSDGESLLEDPSTTVDFDSARKELSVGNVKKVSSLETLSRILSASLLRPNLVYNGEKTKARRADAAQGVSPVLYQIHQGEIIVREGDRVTADQAKKLKAHAAKAAGGGRWSSYLLLFSVFVFVTGICYEYGRKNIRKTRTGQRDLLFMALTFLFLLLVQRLTGMLAANLDVEIAEALRFAAPLAAGLVVVRMVLNSETALIFAIPFLCAGAVGGGLESGFFLPLLAGSLVGAHLSGGAWRRIDFFRIGAWIGTAQMVAVLMLKLQEGGPFMLETWWSLGGAMVGGMLSGFLVLALVPIAEVLFGYTTDMRLMELASLDHPLLRDLMIRAPGTYHHSMVTSSLVKSAAEAIGARAVLATVACYYHDIGKANKPGYFIENQGTTNNPHDKLAPSMSALVLTAHVKEGVEMAEKYRLGKDVIDIIRQHHGTALIHYFFEKASNAVRPGVEEAREEKFRYPGPKPQTREAALVMLADAVEAAGRTLSDPKPARIQGMVQNLINRIFAAGQLDECDLALQDLHLIARSFTHILSGIHHQRIDYPLAAQKERKEDADTDSKRQPEQNGGRGEAGGEGEENLKRLGM